MQALSIRTTVRRTGHLSAVRAWACPSPRLIPMAILMGGAGWASWIRLEPYALILQQKFEPHSISCGIFGKQRKTNAVTKNYKRIKTIPLGGESITLSYSPTSHGVVRQKSFQFCRRCEILKRALRKYHTPAHRRLRDRGTSLRSVCPAGDDGHAKRGGADRKHGARHVSSGGERSSFGRDALLPIEGADAERLRQMHLHGGLCGQMLHRYDDGPLSTALEDFGRRHSSAKRFLA
jgi:hypothetical protein